MPRLFTAVAISDEARATLAAVAARAPVPGRWVPAANLHVTLRFIGGVTAAKVPEIAAALAQVRAPAGALALAGVGAFPAHASARTPRILWAGVAPHAPLAALKAAIDGALGPDPEARAYTPHVTLARLPDTRGPAREALTQFLAAETSLASAPFAVASFVLYESRTSPGGSIYTPLARYPLA
jgi:RNA 2',3'-cyclic 3'-phosphodiesterase